MDDILNSLGKLMGGARDGAEQGRDMAEAEAEASTMSPARLQAQIQLMMEKITEKTELLQMLQEKLKTMPIAEMLGEKGSALKDQVAEIMQTIDSLRTRLAVFQKAAK